MKHICSFDCGYKCGGRSTRFRGIVWPEDLSRARKRVTLQEEEKGRSNRRKRDRQLEAEVVLRENEETAMGWVGKRSVPRNMTITCKRGNCEVLPSSYIGMTTTKLSRRLTCHFTSGTPKSILLEKHGITITRKYIEENTEMVDMCADIRRLPILEALYIKDNNPKLNVQAHDLKALPSMRRTKGSDIQPAETQSEEKQKPSTNDRRPLTRKAARLL
ncbi:hypothetical protein GWK47_031150 [Chionoecetes opilio]|uniref:Uncharacterized protein n=1 Tax=Chionoecetes opilio TaxID=41210 RepID=A0A8J4YRB1_CHIOP|nr:hypothetical protein GWK47_031150 [Chionoecetes opilio]